VSLLLSDAGVHYSRWYGNGGDWINLGILYYSAIDRKPENGGEIQDTPCGMCGIMLGLEVAHLWHLGHLCNAGDIDKQN
jgi:hypothetical protein